MRRGVVNPAALAAVILWMTGPALAVTYRVNSNGDGPDANTGDGTCETSTPGQCTLRAAVQQANVTGGTINVPAMTITLTDYLAVQHDMSIVGAGMRATVVSGAGLYQIFDVGSPVATPLTVTISDMTLRDGHANAFNGGDGVAIHQYQGKLTVDRCFFTNNYATYGGAILADHTETKIRDSVFTDNHAPDGIAGAIWAFASSLTMINVALTGNSADTGGALVLTLGSYGTLT
ncbi:MAG TPA: hypothetical protein VKF32_08980, partial [Thermoanaerobaculia bacterium]|nr:hypothetical protein [Thermoanaerobaculia bacterium]